jgi:hypothetical protein
MFPSAQDHNVTLENGDLRAGFNSHGDLISMESSPLGMCLFPPAEQDIGAGFTWGVFFEGDESPRRDWQRTWTERGDDALRFEGRCDTVEIGLQIDLEGMGCSWKIHLINGGQRTIDGVEFCLRGPFSFAPEVQFTYPYCAGWAIPFSGIRPSEPLTLQYPAKAAMQWTSIFAGGNGVYLGLHDGIPFYKELTWNVEGGNPMVRALFDDLVLDPGQSISLPPVHLALHDDDWRGGARIYRAWAQEHVGTPAVPQWYERKPSWAWVGLKDQFAQEIMHRTEELSDVSSQAAEAGLDLIQLTAYTEDGHDTLYPDYVPGEELGGTEGLSEAVKSIHSAGKRISIYVNGRLVDPASSLDEEKRASWAVRTRRGASPITETYGEVTFDVMCPGAPEWREHFIDKLSYLVHTFDIDGIYIDQVCGARSYPCYTPEHDHDRPCLAWSHYKKFMSELRRRLLAIKPELFLATEGVNDLLGQYFDSMQAHNDWPVHGVDRAQPLHDLYLYTFPEHLFNVGCITEDGTGEYYLRLAHLSGSGCDFGVRHWERMPQALLQQARRVMNWHTKHYDALRFGERVLVTSETRAVEAQGFMVGAKLFVNGVSLGDEDVDGRSDEAVLSVETLHGKRVQQIEASDLERVIPCEWTETEDGLEVRLPALDIFSIVIEWK